MKKFINFEYKESALISEEKINADFEFLKPEIESLNEALSFGYDSSYAFINSPGDKELLKKIKEISQKVSLLDPSIILVIGIGGSNLGALAVFEALKGRLHNLNSKLKFFCADLVDNDYIFEIYKIVKSDLEEGKNVIINIVTKSGTTTETIANGAIFVDLLKKYKKDFFNYLFITTDRDSSLHKIAKEKNFNILEIPKLIGGRFSVLSAVGSFPLALLGIDIESLQAGAKDIQEICLSQNLEKNPAALSAAIIYEHYINGKNINDLFVFSPDYFSIGSWYRQLIGESLGKKHNLKSETVETGITPTVSVGTTDLHSVAQLYLGGPRDKITTFLSVECQNEALMVPENEISKAVKSVENKSLIFIEDSILSGVKLAFKKENRPFISINIPEKNEYYLGQFLMFKMIETVFLAKLLNVNAFDQPAVELYKKETRRIIGE